MKLPKVKYINIVKFLEKRFPEILLILLLLLICILSIQPGKYLLSNDNYSPELNPTLSVSRYLESPAWRGYRVLGFASESEQADVFRSSLFSFMNVFLPTWSISQVFALIALVVGTFSTAYLVRFFIKEYVTKKYSGTVFLVSGIMYFTTLWTAWVFNFNIMAYVTQFGFLPLLLLSIYLLFREWRTRNFLFFILSSILFTSSSVIATLFFVNLILIFLFILFLGFLRKVEIKKMGISFGVFILTQFFWLLPFGQYTASSSEDIINSYTNRYITANTIDLEAGMMTVGNSARFYTRLLGTVDNPAVNSYIFPMSEDFQAYDIFKVVGLLPFLFSIIGLIFILFKKKWKLIPLWVVLFGIIFLIKNQNPPLGGVYIWLQENISLFKQVFRWVSSKLSQAYLIILVITSTVGFIYLLDFFASYFKKRARKLFIVIPIIVFLSTFLFYSEYLFKGQLFTQRALVELPSQYYSLKETLSEDKTSRIFYAPPANNGYFREYEWGFVGSQFLGYILPNPLMDMSLAIGSDVGERALLELTNDFNSGDITELNTDLEKYDVKYILVDRSLIKGRYGYELDWELIDSYTQTWEKIWSQDFLELYKLENQNTIKYVESYGTNDVLENGSFVRKYSQEPIFSALNVNLNNAYVRENYLVKEIEYEGVNTILYSNYEDLDSTNFPSYIKKSNNQLHVSPSLPIVNDLRNKSYRRFDNPPDEDSFYIVNESVFTQDQIKRGVNLYAPWKTIENIYVVSESSLFELDLTDIFSNTNPGDCSGGNYKVLPNVTAQETASGFTIEGSSKLPCLYTQIRLDKRFKYIGQISLNWESNTENMIGYCLYSSKAKGCLNEEKFLYTDLGFGNTTITFPTLLDGADELSLTLYALNPKGEKASLLIRDVKILYSSEFVPLNKTDEYIDDKEKILEINNGEKIVIEIPLMNNGNSYVYSGSEKENELWQPSVAQDAFLKYEISLDDGLKQIAQKQYANQYQELYITNPLKRYLWYWSGENLKNIPSTVCLTYVGDDKCFVDNTFYDDALSSETRIFSSSIKENTRLDSSFNSISFHNETENILKDFIVMEIPDVWLNYRFQSIFPREYTEYEALVIGKSSSSTFYSINKDEISSRDTIISIPQARADGWVAVGFTDFFFRVLPNSSRVSLDGWKQGWDISEFNNLNSVFIFYWPNLLSYIGYSFILVLFIYPVYYFIKRKKIWKKIFR